MSCPKTLLHASSRRQELHCRPFGHLEKLMCNWFYGNRFTKLTLTLCCLHVMFAQQGKPTSARCVLLCLLKAVSLLASVSWFTRIIRTCPVHHSISWNTRSILVLVFFTPASSSTQVRDITTNFFKSQTFYRNAELMFFYCYFQITLLYLMYILHKSDYSQNWRGLCFWGNSAQKVSNTVMLTFSLLHIFYKVN